MKSFFWLNLKSWSFFYLLVLGFCTDTLIPTSSREVTLLSLWKELYQLSKLFIVILVTDSLIPYKSVQSCFGRLLNFIIFTAMSCRDHLCRVWTNKSHFYLAKMYLQPVRLPEHLLTLLLRKCSFPISPHSAYMTALHAEVFADLLSASPSISQLPLVWLFLFSPEQSSMSQLLSSMKLALLHHFTSWRSGQ